MPCERIVELLAGLGLAISKRQVVRLLIAKLDRFRAEDAAVLRAGLIGAPFVTVDDTGARHAGKGCFTTHIGADRFAAFRTGPGKSRLAFLSRLLGGAARYVINAAALAYMRAGICRGTSSTGSPAMPCKLSARTRNGWATCTRSA